MRKNEVICSVRPAEEREEHNFSLSLSTPNSDAEHECRIVWIAFRPPFFFARRRPHIKIGQWSQIG